MSLFWVMMKQHNNHTLTYNFGNLYQLASGGPESSPQARGVYSGLACIMPARAPKTAGFSGRKYGVNNGTERSRWDCCERAEVPYPSEMFYATSLVRYIRAGRPRLAGILSRAVSGSGCVSHVSSNLNTCCAAPIFASSSALSLTRRAISALLAASTNLSTSASIIFRCLATMFICANWYSSSPAREHVARYSQGFGLSLKSSFSVNRTCSAMSTQVHCY